MHDDYLQCLNSGGFHRLHYTDWGDPTNPRVVICVHGLTRNCRDFDALAQTRASRMKKHQARPGGLMIDMKKIQLLSQLAVVALLRFLQNF